jgi:hypothetical protein
MKSVGILQPGKLGDIIICLPIAKYYHDNGYKVYWPVFSNYKNMVEEVIDYVTFYSVTENVYNCFNEAKVICEKLKPTHIFDIAATFPGSSCTEEYVKLGDGFGEEKFDQFKYRKCNVPFEQKWRLEYKRNGIKEQEIINDLVKNLNYDVVSVKHSRGQEPIKFESKNQIIEVNTNYNIFHWRKLLENAQKLAFVDSAISNLTEQLNIQIKKILIKKPGHPTPVYRNNWRIISL